MSPVPFRDAIQPATEATIERIWALFGTRIREARLKRGWSTTRLAGAAGMSRTLVYLVERGEPASVETAARLAGALNLALSLDLTEPRRRIPPAQRAADPVHAAMGEFEAAHLRPLGFDTGIDEPYQHYHFAGRADVTAWQGQPSALLHIENRTQYPDIQAMAGSWNGKRAYLADAIAERVGVPGPWGSVTHVMVALWSREVQRALQRHPETFRSLCRDPADAFEAWWSGHPPARGSRSTFVLLDPFSAAGEPAFIGLEEALRAKPRMRDYAEAAGRLRELVRRTG
jgi:transcriptional regulator with XRE-family HTH domain